MKKLRLKYLFVFVLALIAALLIDRIIKYAAFNYMGQDMALIDGFLKLTLSKNVGIAFSIGLPMFVQLMIFPVLFACGLFFIYKYYDASSLFVQLVAGFIAGGAVGNFIDRVMFGYVIDYISVSIFPVFNIADMEIVIGIFLLVAFYGKIKRV